MVSRGFETALQGTPAISGKVLTLLDIGRCYHQTTVLLIVPCVLPLYMVVGVVCVLLFRYSTQNIVYYGTCVQAYSTSMAENAGCFVADTTLVHFATNAVKAAATQIAKRTPDAHREV